MEKRRILLLAIALFIFLVIASILIFLEFAVENEYFTPSAGKPYNARIENIDEKKMKDYERRKSLLMEDISQLEEETTKLKAKRKETPRHIVFSAMAANGGWHRFCFLPEREPLSFSGGLVLLSSASSSETSVLLGSSLPPGSCEQAWHLSSRSGPPT